MMQSLNMRYHNLNNVETSKKMDEKDTYFKIEGKINLELIKNLFDEVKDNKVYCNEIPCDEFPDKAYIKKNEIVDIWVETEKFHIFYYVDNNSLWISAKYWIYSKNKGYHPTNKHIDVNDLINFAKPLVLKFDFYGFGVYSMTDPEDEDNCVYGLNYVYINKKYLNEYMTKLFEKCYEQTKNEELSLYTIFKLNKNYKHYNEKAERMFERTKEGLIIFSKLIKELPVEKENAIIQIKLENGYKKDLGLSKINYSVLLNFAQRLDLLKMTSEEGFNLLACSDKDNDNCLGSELRKIFLAVFSYHYYYLNKDVDLNEFITLSIMPNLMPVNKEVLLLLLAIIEKKQVLDNTVGCEVPYLFGHMDFIKHIKLKLANIRISKRMAEQKDFKNNMMEYFEICAKNPKTHFPRIIDAYVSGPSPKIRKAYCQLLKNIIFNEDELEKMNQRLDATIHLRKISLLKEKDPRLIKSILRDFLIETDKEKRDKLWKKLDNIVLDNRSDIQMQKYKERMNNNYYLKLDYLKIFAKYPEKYFHKIIILYISDSDQEIRKAYCQALKDITLTKDELEKKIKYLDMGFFSCKITTLKEKDPLTVRSIIYDFLTETDKKKKEELWDQLNAWV